MLSVSARSSSSPFPSPSHSPSSSSSSSNLSTMAMDIKAINVSLARVASLVAIALFLRMAFSISPSFSPSSSSISPSLSPSFPSSPSSSRSSSSSSPSLEKNAENDDATTTSAILLAGRSPPSSSPSSSFLSSDGGATQTLLPKASGLNLPSTINHNDQVAAEQKDGEEISYGYEVERVRLRTRPRGKHGCNRDLDAILKLIKPSPIYGPDVPRLRLRVRYETKERLRVHITAVDGAPRWEVPRNLFSTSARTESERIKSDGESTEGGQSHLQRTGSLQQSSFSSQARRVMLGEGSSKDREEGFSGENKEEDKEEEEEKDAEEDDLTTVMEDGTLPMSPDPDRHPLSFSYTDKPFGFAITRHATGEVLFNSTPGTTSAVRTMAFKDQYLELSTATSPDSSLYGIGESTRPDGFRLTPNRTHTLWAADISSCNANMNLYGVHPYYLDLRKDGSAHGVLLFNSNGMDVQVNEDSIQYRVLGGVFDFFFFTGPSPAAVTDQYTQLVGRPAPMPYWTFGLQQCRYGYRDLHELEDVVQNYSAARIPLEGMWADIDYMHGYRDFTFDPEKFPEEGMRSLVNHLHRHDQHFVAIVDPGIKVDANFSAYQRGVQADIFIKDVTGKPYVAQVWPGATHIPDFLNPRTRSYWEEEIREFHNKLGFDGLWIDMNEPANFCSGVVCSVTKGCPVPGVPPYICCLSCQGTDSTDNDHSGADNVSTKWDRPPYKINSYGQHAPIGTKTLPASSQHINGILHYNAHNIFGLSQAQATLTALRSVMMKRPFLLSRATFPGSGAYAAHWSGDNCATWKDLAHSITAMLNMGLFGISMTGSDICGFRGNTTEELCRRWVQVGSFYPFARDHSDIGTLRQELYQWESVAETARKHLSLRYRLLPYFYTRMHEATSSGLPIVRPLFFTFPKDAVTHAINQQFLVGRGLMVSPVLEEGAEKVNAYFPEGSWYNLQDFSFVQSIQGGRWVTLPAPQHTINVHVFEGEILPMQQPGMTTAVVRRSPFSLFITFPAWHEPCTDYNLAEVSSLIADNQTAIDSIIADKQMAITPWLCRQGHPSLFPQTEPLLLSATAKGDLYIDDDRVVQEMVVRDELDHATYITFDGGIKVYARGGQSQTGKRSAGLYGKGSLQASVVKGGQFACKEGWMVDEVVILGPSWAPNHLTINGKTSRLQRDVQTSFDPTLHKTYFFDMNLKLCDGFTLEWEGQW
ncbi:hypothetical protein CBR_g24401 [Chara braunii]|uniref:Maltase n=1 Tax=Chara braunii TaxID=69332 RepID=A0A388JMR8_CHABU|nr:hypothetical protein CBR_g24401 [Chara braunii]|eukprot:GBG59055.1 hypothetical protein CBR_g24401 [Chara braunii]